MYAHFRVKTRCDLLCVHLNVFANSVIQWDSIWQQNTYSAQFSTQAEELWAGTQGNAAKQVQSTVVGKTDKLLLLVEYLVLWWNCKIRQECKGTKQLACPPIWQHVRKTPYWKISRRRLETIYAVRFCQYLQ